MNTVNKKLKEAYKETRRPMGIFLIRNAVTDRVFVAWGVNLAGIMNRQRFALKAGSHPNKELQRDWNKLGSKSFEFEIVEQRTPPDEPGFDEKAELEFMEQFWLERLQPFGKRGYNQRKLSREELLRLMSSRSREA
jgi:hypothetical protein